MIPALLLVLVFAVLDWVAVARGWRKVERFAKPATLLVLFLILLVALAISGFQSLPMILFVAGLLFSLAGDIFLLFAERWFMYGLAAFLLAHLSYIAGLNVPLPMGSTVWSIGIAIILALTAGRILQRIVVSMRAKGLRRMVAPVVAYAVVITIMLLSALLTLFRLEWGTLPAVLVALGASLFYFSDLILAWNKFVTRISNGRLINMISYHLGQILLVLGVFLQFGN